MRKGLIAATLALFVALFGISAAGAAGNFRASTNPSISRGETVNSSVYLAGQTVTVDGTVNGDVFCAGQTITINGTVNGDVICAGQSVTVTGKVDGNIRVAGQTVDISSSVSHNATLVGQQITVESDTVINGDLTATGANISLLGKVGRDAVLAGATLDMQGNTARNVTVRSNDIQLSDNARVGGDFEYTSTSRFSQPGGVVAGHVIFHQAKESQQTVGNGILNALLGGLMLLASWMVLALIVPGMLHGLTSDAMRRPGRVALLGIAGAFLVPLVALFAFVTVLGVPLGVTIVFAWLLALALGGPLAAYLVGRLVLPRSRNALLFMLVGGLIVVVAYNVPFLNVLVVLASFALSIGLLLSYWFGHPINYTLSAAPAKPRAK